MRARVIVAAVLTACVSPSSSSSQPVARPTLTRHAPSPDSPFAPEDAVLPYSVALEKSQPFARPFTARFQKGDQSLLFVAADHGCDPRTFRLIDDVFAAVATDEHLQLVVITKGI